MTEEACREAEMQGWRFSSVLVSAQKYECSAVLPTPGCNAFIFEISKTVNASNNLGTNFSDLTACHRIKQFFS